MPRPAAFSLVRGRTPLALLALLVLAGCATTPEGNKVPPLFQATYDLREAEKPPLASATDIGLFLDAAQDALGVAADPHASAVDRTKAIGIYNTAVTECAIALKKKGALPAGRTTASFPGAGTTYVLSVPTTGEGIKRPAEFTRFVNASKIYRKHLKANIVRDGLGGSLVGAITEPENVPNRAPGGFAEPLTAVASFGSAKGGRTPVALAFYDPRAKAKVSVDGTTFALRGDFTAPLAFFPRTRPLIFGIVAMLRSDLVAKRMGLYFTEPYDPQKIPIIFTHGLMSSPHAWINFVNELDASPDFRRRYQPVVVFYPSGGPIAGNALKLREEMAAMEKHYAMKRNIVMVGHSMGGILTDMQVVNTGRVLWDAVFGAKADEFYKSVPPTSILKRALVFTANPDVTHAIFFSTPHRGSGLADMRISAIASGLIRMPAAILHQLNPETMAVLRQIRPGIRSVPSSIMGLSPRNPLLKGLAEIPIAVPYNSIIGNQGKNKIPLAQSSDGVVPYWSSHRDGAQSELIVPTGHDSFDCPQSVAEVLRILQANK